MHSIDQLARSQTEPYPGKRRRARRRALAAAFESALREVWFYKAAINSLPNPIFIKDEGARFVFFNAAYERFFAMKAGSYCGKTVHDLDYLPLADRSRYQQEDLRMIRETSQVHYEVPFVSHEGVVRESLYWSSGFYVGQTDQRGLIGEIVDISNEKELQRSLECSMEQLVDANRTITEHARRDPLTGLLNRSVLHEEVTALLQRAAQQGCSISILVADLDHFKRINDTCGHQCGDELLISFAKVLKEQCRQGDLAIRYGGEEFIVILPFTESEQARCVAERICKATNTVRYKRERDSQADSCCLSVSIGVTQYILDERMEDFLARGDLAMYQAKKNGRGCVVLV